MKMNYLDMMHKIETHKVYVSGAVKTGIICSMLLAGSVLTGPVVAADSSLDNLSEKQRIQRLERMLDSDILRQQTETIQSLRDEIATLREQTEQQEYELDSMKQRQRNLYLDMDRRINNVEAGGRNSSGISSAVPPPSSSATKAIVPVAGVVTAGDADGQVAYSQAFGLLKEGQYKQSITAFEKFKVSYPNSKYADNAQYWLGEANYVSRYYKKALTEFQQLIARYPDSSKNSGARLKIGYVYFELKNWSAARDALEQVIVLYPDTTVAKKANERMQRMKREGH